MWEEAKYVKMTESRKRLNVDTGLTRLVCDEEKCRMRASV